MTLSMYQAAVPPFVNMLTNLSTILGKAAAHAEARKIDPAVLLNTRLFPDMLPFTTQIQIAADAAKFGAGRLAGVEMPKFPDTETTIPELQERIAKTIAFLKSLKPEQVDGSEDKQITFKGGSREMSFKGQAYLLGFAQPNFYFHVTTAYAILRHCGIEIGKRDYLGPI